MLTKVAPDIPPAVQRRVGLFDELLVQVSVRADGTVADAAVLTAGMRPVESYVVDALRQWRFEPPGQPRTLRITLVFNSN